MIFDLSIGENGNGGDLQLKGNDLELVFGIENEAYLAMFGGNPEQDTPTVIVEEQSLDYWANDLMYKGNPATQFNSKTERTLNTTVLNSSGRVLIEDAVKADLSYLSEAGATITVKVTIISDDRLSIYIKISMPDGSGQIRVINLRKQVDGDFFIQDFNDDFFL